MSKPFIDKIGLSHLITVLKDIFSKKADLVDGKVPIEQLPDDIGGGLSEVAWNDIKDPPFGETKAFDDIIWDGSLDGKTYVEASVGGMNGVLYKVSDEVLTRDQIEGASLCADGMLMGSSGDVIEPASVYAETETGSLILNGALAYSITTSNEVVSADAIGAQFTFPEPGIWFIGLDAGGFIIGVKSLIAANKTKQLDSKFIPDLGHVSESKIGSANGIASLDENTKIPIEQIPVDEIKFATSEWRLINRFEVKKSNLQGTGFIASLNSDTGYIDNITITSDSLGNPLNPHTVNMYIINNTSYGVETDIIVSINGKKSPIDQITCITPGSRSMVNYKIENKFGRNNVDVSCYQSKDGTNSFNYLSSTHRKAEIRDDDSYVNEISLDFIVKDTVQSAHQLALEVEIWGIE